MRKTLGPSRTPWSGGVSHPPGSGHTPETDRRLRALNIPVPVQVVLGPSGHPSALHTRRGIRKVEAILEIWRIDDEWWRQPIHRRYLSLLLEGGRPVTLFQDLVDRAWYLQEG